LTPEDSPAQMSEVERAAAFLLRQLEHKPQRVKELIELAEFENISKRSLEGAKARVGFLAKKGWDENINPCWYWCWPNQDPLPISWGSSDVSKPTTQENSNDAGGR
jgi:hypothetical protein